MSIFMFDLSTTLATRVACLALGFMTNVVVARSLGSVGMGEYTLIMTTLNFLLLCGTLGLDVSNVYFAGQRKYPLGGLMANTIWMSLLGGVAIGGIWWVAREWSSRTVLQGVDPSHLLLGIVALPALLARTSLQGLLRGLNRITAWNGMTLVNAVTSLVLLVLVLRGFRWGVLGAVSVQLITAAGLTAALLILLSRGLPWRWTPHGPALRAGIGYGMKIQASTIVNFFNYSLNYYLLNLFLTTQDVGHYSVAVALTQPVLLLASTMQIVLFPKISVAETGQAELWMPAILRQTMVVMAGALLLLALLSGPIIRWCYGPGYTAAITPLRLLIPGCFGLSMNTVLSAYNSGRGRPDLSLYATIMALGITWGLGWWLIPRHGLTGAALASTIAFIGLWLAEFIGYLYLSKSTIRESIWVTGDDLRAVGRALGAFATGRWRAAHRP